MKIIIQHSTEEQKPILDLVKDTNQTYAKKFGFEYVTDMTSRVKNRKFYWEKIAYLNELLPTLPNEALVVWEDVDSLNVGDESFKTALPPNGVFGMVQNRYGLNRMQLQDWFNSGVIVFINSHETQTFFKNAWNWGGDGDEDGLMKELKVNNYKIGHNPITSLHPKWNCWKNNVHLCQNPVVRTFHGMSLDKKIDAIKETLCTKT
jgi:hypothetical protein